ncbi:hypothetical protein AJ80_03542 [Polytolypa hystricis UAMH7299]|uniref:Chalcone isomerase domain-containing protein n=1 Tax=Polytolypa hystricis (strain UAMH7299) TaxID=1447883 RepID=A0A2B7YIF2_POLH7|nr:hypothetical protein AJ80_03542 [Polytolypa hystricis UAMH7299]
MNIPSSLNVQLRQQFRQCAKQARTPSRAFLRHGEQQQRLFSIPRVLRSKPANPLRRPTLTKAEYEFSKRRIMLCSVGILTCAIGMYTVIKFDVFGVSKKGKEGQVETSNSGSSGITLDGSSGLVDPLNPTATVILNGIEQVPTGNSTIPTFPKIIHLPKSLDASTPEISSERRIGAELPNNDSNQTEEYQLLGVGIRSVSFLSIQVYVVGVYIASGDVVALQQRLVRQAAAPATRESSVTATSLISSEREALKQALLDPENGEEVWNEILKEGGIRTALRIVPTRNTDFLHLRDGWVRQVTARAQKANARVAELAQKEGQDTATAPQSDFADDSFGNSLNDFKTMFGGGVRKNVPKGQTLFLLRDKLGALEGLFQVGERKPLVWLGEVRDERISRLVWLGYLAGKTVASEEARKNVIDGVMKIVERPVGTVEQKVV